MGRTQAERRSIARGVPLRSVAAVRRRTPRPSGNARAVRRASRQLRSLHCVTRSVEWGAKIETVAKAKTLWF